MKPSRAARGPDAAPGVIVPALEARRRFRGGVAYAHPMDSSGPLSEAAESFRLVHPPRGLLMQRLGLAPGAADSLITAARRDPRRA